MVITLPLQYTAVRFKLESDKEEALLVLYFSLGELKLIFETYLTLYSYA